MSQVFIGIVFVAIVGGAAESGSAIAMARKNKMDLSIGIALGSCIQIALFVAPVLVLASYFIAPHPLALSFGRAEIGSLFMAVLIGALVCGDGQSNWYKGSSANHRLRDDCADVLSNAGAARLIHMYSFKSSRLILTDTATKQAAVNDEVHSGPVL